MESLIEDPNVLDSAHQQQMAAEGDHAAAEVEKDFTASPQVEEASKNDQSEQNDGTDAENEKRMRLQVEEVDGIQSSSKDDEDKSWYSSRAEEGFSSLIEFVENEIWAKSEDQWRFPTTAGFAQKAVDLGLCEDVKQAKKQIKELFLASDFSARRVLDRFLRLIPEEQRVASEVDSIVDRMMTVYGGAITPEVARREIRVALGLVLDDPALESDSEDASEEDDDQQKNSSSPAVELDPTTKAVISRLVSHDQLRSIARKSGLDLARMPQVRALNLEAILSLIEQLDHVESSSKGDAKQRRGQLLKFEKKARSIAPLTYQLSKYPAKAVTDLLDLAQIAVASHLSLPRGVSCSERPQLGPNSFSIQHEPALMRFRPFASSAMKNLAWFSTTPVGAAFVLQNGYPFPGLDREVILHGRRRKRTMEAGFKEARVWVLFEVAVDLAHCGIEEYQAEDGVELDDDDRDAWATECQGAWFDENQRIHMYDVDAMHPVMLMISA